MANPQKEDGHIQIANEILEALVRAPIGHTNLRALLVIIRKTYGWNKKEDRISISQIAELTGMSRRSSVYALQNLESMKVIKIKRQRGRGHRNEINEISLNKNHEEWVVQERAPQYRKVLEQRKKHHAKYGRGGSARTEGVVQERANKVSVLAPTKDTTTKDKQKGLDFSLPEWFPKEVWKEFLAHRKKKGAGIAKESYGRFVKKFERWKKAGWGPETVVGIMVDRGWKGFKIEWVKEDAESTGEWITVTEEEIRNGR